MKRTNWIIIIIVVFGLLIATSIVLFISNNKKDVDYDQLAYVDQVAEVIAKIKSDPEWAEAVRKEAVRYGMDYNERLAYEAKWQLARRSLSWLMNHDYK